MVYHPTIKSILKKPNKVYNKPKPELDPLDLLSEDFDVVDQTIDQGSLAIEESNNFQDTIIGSQYLLKFSSKGSKNSIKSVRNQSNVYKSRMQKKVPPLNFSSHSNNKFSSIKSIESNDDDANMIDMLLSEEGNVIEESIIQFTENSISNKHPVED